MYSIIYSADNAFQVISTIKGNTNKAWIVANEMSRNGTFKQANIEHYDVVEFKTLDKLNEWTLEQVSESRQ